MLTPEQATNIASNRDIRMGSKLDYLYQVMIMMIVMMIVMMISPSDPAPVLSAGHQRGAG